MSASAIFMGVIGISLGFAPAEILEALGQEANALSVLILQLTGALYFGFSMLNWMAKTILIGGIYARPVSIGNFCHFGIAGLTLIKSLVASDNSSFYLILLAGIYTLFAICFGYVFLTSPTKKA